MRPVLITSVGEVARSDLADRSILVTRGTIAENNWLAIASRIEYRFEAARHLAFGALMGTHFHAWLLYLSISLFCTWAFRDKLHKFEHKPKADRSRMDYVLRDNSAV